MSDPREEKRMAEDFRTNVFNVNNFKEYLEPEEKVAKKSGYFFVIGGPLTGQMFKLDNDEIVIGRSTTASIRIDDDGVSRCHARVVLGRDGNLVLEDTGSTNGTFVNGEKVHARVLSDGDRVQIGATSLLKFSYQDSEEEAFQQRLYESAIRDGLTGAFNKRYFHGLLQTEFSFAWRHNVPLSLVLFDIDHFKRINDTHGHQAGDEVLKNLTQVVNQTVRREDLLSRIGGEEFSVLLRQTERQAALICAERIRQAIAGHTFRSQGVVIPVTVSLGVATLIDRRYSIPDDYVRAADTCLYTAKHGGRNRVINDVHPSVAADMGQIPPPPDLGFRKP